MAVVSVDLIEEVIAHLDEAISPKVAFQEDFEAMRREAELSRLASITRARRLIIANVGGLDIRYGLSIADRRM